MENFVQYVTKSQRSVHYRELIKGEDGKYRLDEPISEDHVISSVFISGQKKTSILLEPVEQALCTRGMSLDLVRDTDFHNLNRVLEFEDNVLLDFNKGGRRAIGLQDLAGEFTKIDVEISEDGVIDMGLGIMTALFTMTKNIHFSFKNARVGKTFKILFTGDYSHTWNAGFDADEVFKDFKGDKVNVVTVTPIRLGDSPLFEVYCKTL